MLFAAIVVVVLAWVAMNTLFGGSDDDSRVTYSQAIGLVEKSPRRVDSVLFSPREHELEVRFRDGRALEVDYPSDEAQFAFQRVLEREAIPFDAEGSGESPWWGLLTALLPFVILIAFWAFLMRTIRSPSPERDPVLAELREIRRLLERER